MRRLNGKLTAGLLVGGLVLGTGVHALHGVQAKRSAGAYQKRSEEAEKAGDLKGALNDLAQYLRYEPDDDDARARYALLAERVAKSTDDYLLALTAMEFALRRAPDRRDLRRRAVDIAMDLKRYRDARAHLAILLGGVLPSEQARERPPSAEDGELEVLYGRCYDGEAKYDEAAQLYQAAIRDNPTLVDGYVRYANVLRLQLDKPQDADQVMDANLVKDGLIANNRESGIAYLERGRYRKTYSLPGVEEDLERALELAPDDVDVRLFAAEWAIAPSNGARDHDVARKHLDHAQKTARTDGRLYQIRSLVEASAGRPELAAEALRKGLEVVEGEEPQILMRWELADLLIQQGETEKAREEVEKLREAKLLDELVRFLDAKTLMVDRRWMEACLELEAIRPTLLKIPGIAIESDLRLALCYEQLGLNDRRIETYRRVVDQDPRNIAGRLGLAASLASAGRIEEAIVECRKSGLESPESQIQLARLLLGKNQKAPLARQDWNEIDRLLAQAAAAQPDSVEVPLARASSLFARGKADEARSLVVEARDRKPKQVEFWTFLADLEGARKAGGGLQVLDEAERTLGDRVELRLARIRHLAAQGGPAAIQALEKLEQAAIQALEKLEQDAKTRDEAADRILLLQGLGAAYRQVGDRTGAIRVLKGIANAKPDDLSIKLALFDDAYLEGNEEEMAFAVKGIQDLERRLGVGRGAAADYAQALFLIRTVSEEGTRGEMTAPDRQKLGEARTLLARVVERDPRNTRNRLTLARVVDALGHTDQAIEDYLQVIKDGDSRLEISERAAQLLLAKNRYKEADDLLSGLARSDPTFGGRQELQSLAAIAARKSGNSARAAQLAQSLYKPDSTDFQHHLSYGRMLWEAGRSAEAESVMARAVAVGPEEPAAWIAWVAYLADKGEKGRAEDAVKQLQAKIPANEIPLTLARCFAMLGRSDEAKEQLSKALAARPNDPGTLQFAAGMALGSGRPEEAESFMKRQLDTTGDDPEAASRVRHSLALVKTLSGNYQDNLDARELLGLSRNDEPLLVDIAEPSESLRAKAKVLALQKGHGPRLNAIRILERIADRKDAEPTDLFLLAQLYSNESITDPDYRPKYRDRMGSLLAADGRNPQYLAHYVRHLVRAGEGAAAAPWLAQLESIQPKEPQTVELKARVLAAQGRGAQAAELLESLAREQEKLLYPVARLLEELGQLGPAERAYKQFIATAKAPETALLLAEFYARHDRLSEAIGICEKAWETCPPETVSSACVQVLFVASSFDPAVVEPMRKRVEEAAAKAPEKLEFQFDLANLLIFQRRMDQAEAILRKVHGKVPTASGPLNNLAWLLAIQGTSTDAIGFIDQAIAIDGPIPDLLDTRAMVHLSADRPTDAIKDLNDAIAIDPKPELFFHLARAYAQAGKAEEARENFREAISQGLTAEKVHPLERPDFDRLHALVASN